VVPPWYLEKHDLSFLDTPHDGYFDYITPHAITIGMMPSVLDGNRENEGGGLFNVESPVSMNSYGQSRENKVMIKEAIKPFLGKMPKIDESDIIKRKDERGRRYCSSNKPCICDQDTQVIDIKGKWRIPRCIQDMKDLEEITLDGGSVLRIDNLDGLTNLKLLDLRNNYISKLENVDELESLKILSLRTSRSVSGNNNIKKVENLEPLQELDVLDLFYNKLTRDDSLDGIIPLKKLRRVVINSNKVANNSELLRSIKKKMHDKEFKFIGEA